MKAIHFYLIGLCGLFFSCETVINMDIPVEPDRIVINTFFNPDSTWRIHLTKSNPILRNTYSFQRINDATITLTDEDGEIVELQHTGDGTYRNDDKKPHPLKTYTINVSAPELASVTSSSFCPSLVPITKLEVGEVVEKDDGRYTKVLLHFSDPAELKNFYAITATQEYTSIWDGDTTVYTFDVYIESSDPAFASEYYDGYELFFADALFNGKNYTLPLLVPESYMAGESPISFNLRTTSEAYFQYKKTKHLQDSNEGNPFAQSVTVYNNVENGFGIFAGYSNSTVVYEP